MCTNVTVTSHDQGKDIRMYVVAALHYPLLLFLHLCLPLISQSLQDRYCSLRTKGSWEVKVMKLMIVPSFKTDICFSPGPNRFYSMVPFS